MIIPPFSHVWRQASRIESAVTKDECEALYNLACQVKYGCIAEIGSYTGRSTAVLGFGARVSNRIVYAIDHHQGDAHSGHLYNPDGSIGSSLAAFENNMRVFGLRGTVRPIIADSIETGKAWTRGSIGLLFIDGYHTEEQCLGDFMAFYPHLLHRAMVCFHDFGQEKLGVQKAVQSLIESGHLGMASVVDSMAVAFLNKDIDNE